MSRELVYETNRDVKWICKTLARMEAQDEEFESRLRALERLSGGEGWRGAEGFDDRRRGGRGGDGDSWGAGRGLLQHPVPPEEGLAWVPLVFFKDTREDLGIFCVFERDTEHRFRIARAASDTDHHEDRDAV